LPSDDAVIARTQLRSVALAAALLLGWGGAPGTALAQDVDSSQYDGTWTAYLPCRDGGGQCRARVVLSDFAGDWQDISGSSPSKRMCGGRKMPLTVQASTPSRLAFTVFGDGVSAQCPTLSVLAKPVSPKALSGTFESGRYPRDLEDDDADAAQSAPAKAAPASEDRQPLRMRLERR
jgi:hypothetical protein